MNGNIEKNSDASEGRMNKRSFLKKLDVGAAAAFGAPYVMGASKKAHSVDAADLREHGSRCACNQTRS